MGLFGPGWMKNDRAKALKAIENENDPKKLAEAAMKAPVPDVRERALLRCDDEELYKRAALKDPNPEVRLVAVRRVKDQQTLMQIAGQDTSRKVRETALIYITDESYKIIYAEKINDRDLAMTAAGGVKSELGLAALAATNSKRAVVDDALKRLGRIKTLSKNTLELLRSSNDPKVREFILPYADSPTRIKALRGESDPRKRSGLVKTLDDKQELLRVAVEDKSPGCRTAAYDRLYDLFKKQGKISGDWWKKNIDENTRDQRQAVLLKKSSDDERAARELAEMIAGEQDDRGYLWPRMEMAVIEQLEKMLTEGNENAGKALYKLYKSKKELLNPALHPHAEAQEGRLYQKHKDAMVDSDVCGETFRHDDRMYGEFITPM